MAALVLLPLFAWQAAEANSRDASAKPFSSVIAVEDLELFGDFSLQDAAKRLPGVHGMQDGSFSIRGVGLNRFNLTVDGQRLASSGMGNRLTHPGGFSADFIRDLEIIRVVTPDMDAEALGGVVNLRTFRTPSEERVISAHAGGGLQTRYSDFLSPATRASFFYSDNPVENLFLSLNLHHQNDNRALESLATQYDAADFGDGFTDVLESVAPGLYFDEHERLGGSLQLTYLHGEQAMFHLRGAFANDSRRESWHRYSRSANGNWSDAVTTAAQGRLATDLQLNDTDIQRYMVQTGGEHYLDLMNVSYTLGWSRSIIEKDDYRFPFHVERLAFDIDMADRSRPSMEPVDNAPLRRNLTLQNMDYIVNHHLDNHFTGKLDLKIPHNMGSVKVGSSALLRVKDANEEGAYRKYSYRIAGLNHSSFDDNNPLSSHVFDDDYQLPWILDSDGARSFFHSTLPNMSYDRELFYRESDIWNYRANEQIYGGYGMATFELGMLTLMGGLRIEHTEGSYDGRAVFYNRFGLYSSTEDTTSSGSYTSFFPNARIGLEPIEGLRVQLAYSRTHQRPDYHHLAPFQLTTARDTTIFRGNSALESVVSDNFDLHIEHVHPVLGAVSAGAFYKEISDFITASRRQIEISQGDIPYFDSELFAGEETVISGTERTFVNSDKSATVYGVELSWRHDLRFLPGPLENLGLYATYTWTESEYQPANREEELSLPFQSPHVLNVALSYSQARVDAQLSFYHAAKVLREYADEPRLAPSLGSEAMYLDQYRDGWSDLSAFVRFRISDYFSLWADASNLLNQEIRTYRDSRDLYPELMTLRDGQTIRLGLNYTF
ncbi:TonB-dependent receptor [Balneolales bacterium ANBcel1]|nr:TonB-dependent receptor [Balneolales bacterium ANBcel1]